MSATPDSEAAPDVEAIVAEIRRQASEAEAAFARETAPPPGGPSERELAEGDRAQGNLYANLHGVNTAYLIGGLRQQPGRQGRRQAEIYQAIAPLINELNAFHVQLVRTLNKLVRLLDGHDTELASELMLKTQRRIDLMTQFCNRLSELDDQRLAERVRRLEEDVARLRRGERP